MNKDIKQSDSQNKMDSGYLLSKKNYILMGVGIILLALGFLLMAGGKSEDPNVFNPEIFNFRRITLAPIIVLAGFIVEIIAILRTFKK